MKDNKKKTVTIHALTTTGGDELLLRVFGKWPREIDDDQEITFHDMKAIDYGVRHENIFFCTPSISGDSAILYTDVPGRCILVALYAQLIERKYDNNAEALSKENLRISTYRNKGYIWVYVDEQNNPIAFHQTYICNVNRPEPVLVETKYPIHLTEKSPVAQETEVLAGCDALAGIVTMVMDSRGQYSPAVFSMKKHYEE